MLQKSSDHQVRLVVYPIIHRVSAPSQVVGNGISEPSTVCCKHLHNWKWSILTVPKLSSQIVVISMTWKQYEECWRVDSFITERSCWSSAYYGKHFPGTWFGYVRFNTHPTTVSLWNLEGDGGPNLLKHWSLNHQERKHQNISNKQQTHHLMSTLRVILLAHTGYARKLLEHHWKFHIFYIDSSIMFYPWVPWSKKSAETWNGLKWFIIPSSMSMAMQLTNSQFIPGWPFQCRLWRDVFNSKKNMKNQFQIKKTHISNFPSRWRNKMLTNIVIDPFLLSINFLRLWCPQWHNRWMISHITGTSGISVKLCYFKGATKRKSLKKT